MPDAELDELNIDAEIQDLEAGLDLDPDVTPEEDPTPGEDAEDVGEDETPAEETVEDEVPEEAAVEEPAPAPAAPAPAKAKPAPAAKAAPTKPAPAPAAKPATPAPTKGKATKGKATTAKPVVAAPAAPAPAKPAGTKTAAKAVKAAAVSPAAAKATAEKVALTAAASVEAGEVAAVAPSPEKAATKAATGVSVGDHDPTKIVMVEIASLRIPKTQKQRDPSEMTEEAIGSLARSIKNDGFLNPITVEVASAKGTRNLIAGERRILAFKLLGRTSIPAIEVPTKDAAHRAMLGWAENAERRPPNPMNEAEFLGGLIDAKVFPDGKALATATGYTPSRISQILSRLELSTENRKALREGRLPAKEAEALVVAGRKAKAAAEKAKAEKEAAAAAAGATPEVAAAEGEAAGEVAAEAAAKGKIDPAAEGPRRGPPRKQVNLADLTNPTIGVSESVLLVVKRLPDGNCDLSITLTIGLGVPADFRPEKFNVVKEIADAIKAEITPHGKDIGVGIESAIRVLLK